MKRLSILFVGFAIFMFGCEEIVPPIDLTLTYTGRRVLLEEFTGVQCVNCPEGSKKIEDLVAQHGEYIIPISIHAGFFSEPYDTSLYDFRTPESLNLEANLLGPVQGYPSATVNRTLYPDETELPIALHKWAGYIIQDLLQTPVVDVDINTTYDTTSRLLTVDVDLDFAELVNESVGISVVITEDEIEDVQLTPSGKQYDYKHKHVLRKMLTNYTGDAISPSQTKPGSTPSFSYSYTMPADWNAEKCEVIAFVSKKGATLDVLQVNKTHVTD